MPYASFWMGGFEGADHCNSFGLPLDMAASNGHVERLDDDYAAAAALGLRSVRESIGWRISEPQPGVYQLERAVRMAQAAQRHGIQILWSLMHYGTPPDLNLHDDAFIERFAAFGAAVAGALAPWSAEPPVYTPINEMGFLAWAVSETNLMSPYRGDPLNQGDGLRSGYAVKRRLVRAALAARTAIHAVDPRARFLHIEPMIHVVPPLGRPDLQPIADRVGGYQWHVWDLLSGRLEPELGGSEAALDLMGVNHYHDGQWEVPSGRRIDWLAGDPRRRSPAALLNDVWQRYRRPLLIAETSHVGETRARWLDHVGEELLDARAQGVPVAGVCLYPLVDRLDWEQPQRWHRSGLLEVLPPDSTASGTDSGTDSGAGFARSPHPGYAAALLRWQALLPLDMEHRLQTIVVFSHLRWGFVYQRPQQLMSRLAKRLRVLFVEEPMHTDGPPRLVRTTPAAGVEVLCAYTNVPEAGFSNAQLPVLQSLLHGFLQQHALQPALAWFYTPMALPLAAMVGAKAVVYDCMDELAAFAGAPQQLRDREHALMDAAALVLTGGPSLYAARRDAHRNVHCLPSAVDAAHFASSRLLWDSTEADTVRLLHAAVGTPRIGFFGVIDERMDIALVAALADARPDWQWIMAGPVVKIAAASLPQRPNLHWLGMQPYAVLPYLAASWDVCIMPFALNASTRFISPTKTLEYMAAGKPIVSTAVHDVVQLYGDLVAVGHDAESFAVACGRALAESAEQRVVRQAAMLATVRRMAWDSTAATIADLLQAVLQQAGVDGSLAETAATGSAAARQAAHIQAVQAAVAAAKLASPASNASATRSTVPLPDVAAEMGAPYNAGWAVHSTGG